MTLEQRADLVLAFARTLYINGQATEQTVDAAGRLGLALGLRITLTPRWGDLQLVTHGENGNAVSHAEAVPASVEMDRVARTMGAIEDIAAGRLASDAAQGTIETMREHRRHRPAFSRSPQHAVQWPWPTSSASAISHRRY
jgi:uncharacterized membrane protein YjjP (DUF1212 family)